MSARGTTSPERRAERVSFRVSKTVHAALKQEARRKAAGNISEIARQCVEAAVAAALPQTRDVTPAAAVAGSRRRTRTHVVRIRLNETEAQLLERTARGSGYASVAVFIRSRLFSSLPVRLAGELGAAVQRLDRALQERDLDRLHTLLRQLKADLLRAGAVPRS
jgi:hypothetical protein